MKTSEIKAKLAASKTMLGELAMRMDPLASDDCQRNGALNSMYEACEAEVDRLERTLAVRNSAALMRGTA